MAYSGAWKQNQYFEQPSPVQIVNAKDHGQSGQTPEAGWKDTHTAVIEDYPDVIGDEFWLMDFVGGEQGALVDMTPVDHSHAGSHSTNEGAPQAQYMRKETDIRGPNETYREQNWESYGPEASTISHTALIRGINSLPENNPPLAMYDGKGFRYGYEQFFLRGRDRSFFAKHFRTEHGARPVTPNTAHIPPDSAYDRGRQLWASLASPIDRRQKRPMLRQTPPPLGDTIMEDGRATEDDDLSVIGVF